jgi:uncharacterized Zn finger protein
MPQTDQPRQRVHLVAVKCKCGEQWAVEVLDRQGPVPLRCATCGTVGDAFAHWPLGRNEPLVVFAGDIGPNPSPEDAT